MFYRLIVNGGKFLKTTVEQKTEEKKKEEFIDYEEVDSKLKD